MAVNVSIRHYNSNHLVCMCTCIEEGWQYHSLVDYQLCVKSEFSLQDICAKSAKCHTGFRSSRSNLINVHSSGQSTSQFINNWQFFPLASFDLIWSLMRLL